MQASSERQVCPSRARGTIYQPRLTAVKPWQAHCARCRPRATKGSTFAVKALRLVGFRGLSSGVAARCAHAAAVPIHPLPRRAAVGRGRGGAGGSLCGRLRGRGAQGQGGRHGRGPRVHIAGGSRGPHPRQCQRSCCCCCCCCGCGCCWPCLLIVHRAERAAGGAAAGFVTSQAVVLSPRAPWRAPFSHSG